ncbi:MAG: hypothetical protein KAQ85_11255, partial [Thermodesulfovibrionia bacterium]|nr:hypothetical protein [Thermodesulfovibrionia bacterium]
MDDEQKITQLANTLFSKGLAASLWDAKNKAGDILGLSKNNEVPVSFDKDVDEHLEEGTGEKGSLNNLMENAGVDMDELKKAEDDKIDEIKEDFQKTIDESKEGRTFDNIEQSTIVEEGSSVVDIQEPIKDDVPMEIEPVGEGIGSIENVELPENLFDNSVEGASPEMLVGEASDTGTIAENECIPDDVADISPDETQSESEELSSEYPDLSGSVEDSNKISEES